ncbi:hypothetical protein SAMN05660464_0015 [Geodermatophilus dictyosporus]|uniref:PD-(D/E)XK nuclease superfamily protein n=1 Tax=Geodermatophilus dictyosporus TaxID=1523247 RepID=A0A1I5U1M0_9ACTN|nr:hypothetical protein [Geodermatophilus dictyosporus]SFP89200.1 hypothetical protein SAMN05660464_0015 [Geodermatophilus dictyosporus]
MPDTAAARELFNRSRAPEIAASVDDRLVREPCRSDRFAQFGDADTVLLVAGDQEERAVELALAYGVAWADGRRLLLALPERFRTATAQRIPWLRSAARPTLWLHDGRRAVPAPERSREDTVAAVTASLGGSTPEDEFRRAATALHLRERSDWVTELVDLATRDDRLDPAHTQSERSWHHRGQRVLSVVRTSGGVRVRAGIHHSADPERNTWAVDGPLSAAELGGIREVVDAAIASRSSGDDPAVRRDDEHLLQAVLRRSPAVVGIEQQAMREVPAWRPTDTTRGWARGYVDLVGLDGNGDVLVTETKLEKNADPLFLLQGLDYLVWAQAYRSALTGRLGAADGARIRLALVVGARSDGAPHLPAYTRALAAALDDDVPWTARVVRGWAEPDPRPVGEPLDLLP